MSIISSGPNRSTRLPMTNRRGLSSAPRQRQRGPDLHEGQVGHREEVEQRDRHEQARCRRCRRRSPATKRRCSPRGRRVGKAHPRSGSTPRPGIHGSRSGHGLAGSAVRVTRPASHSGSSCLTATMVRHMTFSIVARSDDGESWGVAVASKFLAVGSAVPAAVGRDRRHRHAGGRQPRLQVPRAGPPRRRRDRAGRPRPAGRGGRGARAPPGGRRRLRRQRRDVDRLRLLRLGGRDDRAQRRARRLRDPGQHPHRPRGGGGDGARVDRGRGTSRSSGGCSRRWPPATTREATAAVASRRHCSSYATGPATAGTTTSPSTCASTTTPTRSPSWPGWSTSTSST